MSADPQAVTRFVSEMLAREGGLCEIDARGAVVALVPEHVQHAARLPESAALRLLGAPSDHEVQFPLESSGMRWLVESALARGRMARAALEGRGTKSHGLSAAVTAAVSSPNAALRVAGTRVSRLNMHLLELRYQAIGEERAEGSLYLAVEPTLRAASAALGAALIAHVDAAKALPGEVDTALALRGARTLEPYARRLLEERLAPLRRRIDERIERDAQRIRSYHDTLGSEARRRRRGAEKAEETEARVGAIARQREQKLAELALRSAVEVRLALTSVIVLEYPASICDLVLLRRRREIPLPVVWDPILHAPLPIPCLACSQPVMAFHACDEAGHLTCTACARPCPNCNRVACRSCQPGGCRTCRSPKA